MTSEGRSRAMVWRGLLVSAGGPRAEKLPLSSYVINLNDDDARVTSTGKLARRASE